MTSFRIFLVLTLLLLVGCATTGKYGEDLGQSCKGADHSQSEDKYTIVKTTQTKTYKESVPQKQFGGIEASRLEKSNLMLGLVNKSLYDEYSIPLVTKIREVHYDSHLIKGFFKTTLALPFFVVFSPLYFTVGDERDRHLFHEFFEYYTWNSVFGCTKKILLDPDPDLDLNKKVKTGKSEWRDATKIHEVLISGFNRDYEYKGENNIDLTQAILTTNLTSTTTLKITCMDCDLLGPAEQKLYKDAKKTVELTYDFRPVKELLIKAEKEKAIQRELQEKENKKAEKERNGAPINRFKEQCMQLGFKAGTQDFGNCVLELNDAK